MLNRFPVSEFESMSSAWPTKSKILNNARVLSYTHNSHTCEMKKLLNFQTFFLLRHRSLFCVTQFLQKSMMVLPYPVALGLEEG